MTDKNANVPWANVPPIGEMLRPAEAARRLGYSASGFYKLARRGLAPTPIKIGPGQSGGSVVPAAWIDAIIADRLQGIGT